MLASRSASPGRLRPSSISARNTICRLTGIFIDVVVRPASSRARSTRSRGRIISTRVSSSNIAPPLRPYLYNIYRMAVTDRFLGSGDSFGSGGRLHNPLSRRGPPPPGGAPFWACPPLPPPPPRVRPPPPPAH